MDLDCPALAPNFLAELEIRKGADLAGRMLGADPAELVALIHAGRAPAPLERLAECLVLDEDREADDGDGWAAEIEPVAEAREVSAKIAPGSGRMASPDLPTIPHAGELYVAMVVPEERIEAFQLMAQMMGLEPFALNVRRPA